MIIKENAKGYIEGRDHLSFIFSIISYKYADKYSLIKLSKEESQRLGFLGREYFECELFIHEYIEYWRMRKYNFEFTTEDM